MQYAQTYHQQNKTGSSKLKLASKYGRRKSKTNPEAKQEKTNETNTPSLVGMNVVNLGEQKLKVKKEEQSKLMRKLKRKREREIESARRKEYNHLYIKKSITSSSKFLLEV